MKRKTVNKDPSKPTTYAVLGITNKINITLKLSKIAAKSQTLIQFTNIFI